MRCSGDELTAATRQGKSMWCQIGPAPEAVTLGIHLGMSGKIVIADADGTEVDGGDYWEGRRQPGDYRWARFTVTFDDGGRLMLVDPRRLGRVRLDPPVEQLGPDAQLITPAQFRAALAAGGAAPVKARIMDQRRIAGIGNLLADEILWRARVHPARAVGSLSAAERSRLLRATRGAISDALRDGGVHTLTIIAHRHRGGTCPRDHAPMAHRRGRRAHELVVPGRAVAGPARRVSPRAWRKSGGRVDPRHVPLDLGVSGPEGGPRIVQGDTVMKYMLVMRATDEAFASMANADFNEMIETVGKFNDELIRAGVLLAAEGLADAAEGVVVDFSSEPPVVTDGPYGETKELFGGFYILNVASKEEAVEWAKRLPIKGPGFKTEIRRVTTIDEFPQDNEWIKKERAWREATGQL